MLNHPVEPLCGVGSQNESWRAKHRGVFINNRPKRLKKKKYFFALAGNSGRLTWVINAQQPQEQRYRVYTHSYQCVYSIVVCPDNGMAASIWNFKYAHS